MYQSTHHLMDTSDRGWCLAGMHNTKYNFPKYNSNVTYCMLIVRNTSAQRVFNVAYRLRKAIQPLMVNYWRRWFRYSQHITTHTSIWWWPIMCCTNHVLVMACIKLLSVWRCMNSWWTLPVRTMTTAHVVTNINVHNNSCTSVLYVKQSLAAV